jgi:hypothetical protein
MRQGATAHVEEEEVVYERNARTEGGGHRGLAFIVGVSILTTSCAPDAPARPVVNLRDSSGVLIVENAGTVALNGGGWSVAPAPSVTVGTVAGDTTQQLFGVAGAHRSADGRIAIVNAGSREVRVYDPEGSFLHSFGGPGAGPEEFGMPVLGGSVADTLIVVDRAHHRISLVHPDAGFVRLVRVADQVGGYLNPSGTFANGQTVFGGAINMRRVGELREGMNRAPTFYRSSNPDGSLGADFGDKLGAEFFVTFPGGNAIPETSLIPFGKTPQATVSPTRFYFGSGDDYEIEAYDPSGTLRSLIRLERDRVPVTEEDRAWYIEEVTSGLEDENQARQVRRRLSQLPVPDVFPPYARLVADVLGYLWVEDYPRSGDETPVWTIFDPNGALVGRVTTPDDAFPIAIEKDYLIAVYHDELDVEYVQLYALERPTGT